MASFLPNITSTTSGPDIVPNITVLLAADGRFPMCFQLFELSFGSYEQLLVVCIYKDIHSSLVFSN